MLRRFFIVLIKAYQKYLSPMKRTKCPYIPTCSCYGLEAVEKHGALLGGIMAACRILRCNPFSHGGYDPVPDKIGLVYLKDRTIKRIRPDFTHYSKKRGTLH
jgi:hypothetical protein